MNTFGMTLQKIHDFSYMATWVYPTEISNERVLLETYTGWVQCGIGQVDQLSHFMVKSYLPLAGNFVRFYQTTESDKPGSIIATTVVASPGAMAPSEDEANVFAVDAASVAPEPQTGIDGKPLCLILSAKLGLLNTTMYNYTYSVNVLTKHDPHLTSQEIPSHVRPAGTVNPDFESPHCPRETRRHRTHPETSRPTTYSYIPPSRMTAAARMPAATDTS